MERELEIAGAASLGGLLRRKAKAGPAPGSACANCGAILQGPYCHACGQPAGDHHRSIWVLAWEGVESLTHLDGRLAQTLPPLFLDPGRLARDFLEGRRQRHVPPFRLFLVSLLIFMLVLESQFHGGQTHQLQVNSDIDLVDKSGGRTRIVVASAVHTPGGAPKGPARPGQADGVNIDIGPSPGGQAVKVGVDGKTMSADEAAAAMREAQAANNSPLGRWLVEHSKRAFANQEYYTMVLFTWAHRLAILLLPILAGLLALVYVGRRRQFYLYDHLIVAMQFLSFEFLIFAVAWMIPDPVRGWALLIATLWTPVNLYMTLRGAYGSGKLAAAIKTLFLWGSTLFLFAALMTGLLALALAEM